MKTIMIVIGLLLSVSLFSKDTLEHAYADGYIQGVKNVARKSSVGALEMTNRKYDRAKQPALWNAYFAAINQSTYIYDRESGPIVAKAIIKGYNDAEKRNGKITEKGMKVIGFEILVAQRKHRKLEKNEPFPGDFIRGTMICLMSLHGQPFDGKLFDAYIQGAMIAANHLDGKK